jgi:hypothetical protein
MRIYKTRRDGLAGDDNLFVGRRSTEIADGHDTITRDADIGIEARSAGTVENGGIADDQIATQTHLVRSFRQLGTGF